MSRMNAVMERFMFCVGFVRRSFGIWGIGFTLGLLLVGMALGAAPALACGGGVVCVDADAPGPTYDGLSWTTAFTDLQAALAVTTPVTEIWVAEGVYYPAHTGGDRNATFALKPGVGVYGGFVATETLRTQRDWDAHATVLSGDIDRNDSQRPVITNTATVTNTDYNAYHVVTGANNATLDGFTITAGRTAVCDNCGTLDRGAGMLNSNVNLTLNHLIIRGNQAEAGGGMINRDSSTVTMTDVWVHDNAALLDVHGIGWGGGIQNSESCMSITDSTISNNRASAFGGGLATDNRNGTTCLDVGGQQTFRVTRVKFIDNYAGSEGGGMENYYASPVVSDSEFTGNSAAEGAGMANSRSTALLTDVLFEGNQASFGYGRGGAMSNWIEADVTLRRVVMRNNRARSEGGAMWNFSSAPTLIDTIISGNVATGDTTSGIFGEGGGVWGAVDGSFTGDGVTRMTNVLISGNCAMSWGGGIRYMSNAEIDLQNVTIVGNRAGVMGPPSAQTGCLGEAVPYVVNGRGGGIQSSEAVTIENTIVWGNWAQTAGTEQLDTSLGGALAASYSDVQNGSWISGTQILTADPLFVAPVSYNSAPTSMGSYWLASGSPVIDQGNNAHVTEATDLSGYPRIVNDIVDMGAYEFRGTEPDLIAAKSNGVGGQVAVGYPFTWTITVTNTGPTAAGFSGSQVILQDDLPTTGAVYGVPAVTGDSSTGISPTNSINCAITSDTLRCTPAGTGITVTIGADAGHFQVMIPVTPTALATLGNPRSGGKCQADPGGHIQEGRENNNDCADTVLAGGSTLVAAIYDAGDVEINSATIGDPVHGRASFLLPTGSLTPTGQVTLKLHTSTNCSGAPSVTDVRTLVDGEAEFGETSARSFSYYVQYGGDGSHLPATSACKLFFGVQPGPTFTVNTTLDDTLDGVCSDIHCTLREAIEAANAVDGANTIRFAIGVDKTITLNSKLPAIRTGGGPLWVDGESNRVTVDGDNLYRVFWATDEARVTLNHLTIVRGAGHGCEQYAYNTCGSGLKVDPSAVVTLTYSSILSSTAQLGGGATNYGTLNILNSTLANNVSTGGTEVGGGAIYNQGALTLQNSTLSGNQAPQGGAIEQRSDGSTTITNCTIVNNTASNTGTSGLSAIFGAMTLRNSIVANNNGTNNFSAEYGSITSLGYNLSNAWNGVTPQPSDLTGDPELGPLTDNGGSTWTHAPLAADSAPVDAGDPGFCLPVDQRGEFRPRGTAGDIGSYERQPTLLSLAKSVTPVTNVAYHGVVTYTIVLRNSDVVPETNLVMTDTLPAEVTFGWWVLQPAGAVRSGDAITWTGTVQAGEAITLSFAVTHTGDYLDVVTNTARLADQASVIGQDDATFSVVCPSLVTVANLNDNGAGSLRQAIVDVCPNGQIDFAPGLSGGTVVLTTTQLNVAKSMTITGLGASNLSISGNDARRVFEIQQSATAWISDLTIKNGKADLGGGIYNMGSLTLERVTVTNNEANSGGGIFNVSNLTLERATVSDNEAAYFGGGIQHADWYGLGTILTVRNSTLSGNSTGTNGTGGALYNENGTFTLWNSTLSGNSTGYGGAIANFNYSMTSGPVTIQNTTLSGNSAELEGGGILNFGGTLNMTNTVIANSLSGGDCVNYATIGVNDRNLIEDGTCSPAFSGDPLLAPLARYGGDSDVHTLLPGSPAIDVGANCPTTDQRDLSRPQGGACDIGAAESPGFHLSYGGGSDQTTMLNTAFAQPLTATVTSAGSDPVDGGQVTYTGPAVGASAQPTVTAVMVTNTLAAQAFIANGVEGSYVVTATMRGNLDPSVPFSLTNVYPGIAVSGNGQFIQIGDATPALEDGTDFGLAVVQGEVVTHTFTVSSSGSMDLIVSDITVSGPAAADFLVTGVVTPTTVPAGAADSFQVRFDPTVWGTRAATVTVISNDPGKTYYDFAVQGDGLEADLVLTETVSTDLVEPGSGPGNLTFVVRLTNNGPSDAWDVTVGNVLTIPIGVDIDSATVNFGSYAFSSTERISGTWALGQFPAGASALLTLTLTVRLEAPPGVITHFAEANGFGLINTGDDAATATAFIAGRDLGIAKTDNLTTTVPSDPVAYTIVVSNAGPSGVMDAIVTDDLPPELTGAQWTCVGDGSGTCVPGGTGNLSTTASLPAGSTITYTVLATIAPDATGDLINTATVTVPVGMRDLDPANNTSTDMDTLVPQADLALVKWASAAQVGPGEPLTYTLIYTNDGPSRATGVTLIDTIPAELRDIAVSSSGAAITDTGMVPPFTWLVGDLGSGSGGVINITGVVSPGLRGGHTFTNTAAIASGLDITLTNNSDRAVVAVLNVPPVARDDVYQTDEDTPLTVPSTGVLDSDTDTNDDPLSAALDTPPGDGTVDLVLDGGFVYTPTADFSGVDTFTYRAYDGQAFSEPATVTITVRAVADLQVDKSAVPSPAVAGRPITYTVVARNLGPSDASSAILSDTLPTVLQNSAWACAASGTTCPSASGTGDLGVVLDMPEGSMLTYTITGMVSPLATGSLSNTASLTVPVGLPERDPADNTASVETLLAVEADLSIAKSHEQAGLNVTYTIVARSAGPSDAAGVVVSDTVPAGLSNFNWTCQAAGGATCGGGGSGSIQDAVDLPAGGVVTYTATAQMAQLGPAVNEAEVIVPAGVTDPDGVNNHAVDRFGGMVYLPMVMNDYIYMPDLVVTALSATTNEARVTIQNVGTVPTANHFWVDVYFNPRVRPPQINQTWWSIASAGAAWGVTRSLTAGESLELVTGGDYYWPSQSSLPPYPVGAEVWTYVDSVNSATTYGTVQESNEGNNTRSAVSSAATTDLTPDFSPQWREEMGNLPQR